MMNPAITSIARFTLLEGWRTRLPLAVLLTVAALFLVAQFAAALALTDSGGYASQVYAALIRLAMVLVVTLAVATSLARELDDRLLDVTWAQPVPRAGWFLGRLAGFVALAAAVAVVAALPLFALVAPPGALAWGLSLAAELALVAAASLTFCLTLRQLTLAVSAVLAFYGLARAMGAVVLMSHGPTVDPSALSAQAIATGVELLARVLPALDRFTQAAWLDAAADWPGEFGGIVLQAAVYIVLLAAVGLFDVYRMDE